MLGKQATAVLPRQRVATAVLPVRAGLLAHCPRSRRNSSTAFTVTRSSRSPTRYASRRPSRIHRCTVCGCTCNMSATCRTVIPCVIFKVHSHSYKAACLLMSMSVSAHDFYCDEQPISSPEHRDTPGPISWSRNFR